MKKRITNHKKHQNKAMQVFKILIYSLFFGFIGCKNGQPKAEKDKPQPFYKEVITAADVKSITPEEAKTYHKDINYQYEYRTGTSGNYEYTYDVNGYDQDGDLVTGIINIEKKYGAGIIIDNNDEEIEIIAEWIDYGRLKATDKNGNEYTLVVN
ncbi:hypothetical protein OIU80_19585 [Flavobacterium sp. LS1R47]|uniref:Lipoprotein n=1 Tax=Flavobacterium frigoritolerans TaxID=2987686 RepID=A0A9X3CAB8_9FLAO|nr:hypothetical protein [Flavobacterium frigoritolerans]MCV9934488.1 hypothetical protein [Flavobacterium frigoritolerans]